MIRNTIVSVLVKEPQILENLRKEWLKKESETFEAKARMQIAKKQNRPQKEIDGLTDIYNKKYNLSSCIAETELYCFEIILDAGGYI